MSNRSVMPRFECDAAVVIACTMEPSVVVLDYSIDTHVIDKENNNLSIYRRASMFPSSPGKL